MLEWKRFCACKNITLHHSKSSYENYRLPVSQVTPQKMCNLAFPRQPDQANYANFKNSVRRMLRENIIFAIFRKKLNSKLINRIPRRELFSKTATSMILLLLITYLLVCLIYFALFHRSFVPIKSGAVQYTQLNCITF